MNRIGKIELLSKFNILKGYLVDDSIDVESIQNVIDLLFEDKLAQELVDNIKEGSSKTILNMVNNKITILNQLIFSNPCEKSWFNLSNTRDVNIKFCSDCGKNVYKVSNEEDYLKRKNLQQCVALDIEFFNPKDKLKKNFKSCNIEFVEDFDLGLPF